MRAWPLLPSLLLVHGMALSQSLPQSPVCQWGDCEQACPTLCPNGTVCSVSGTCVPVAPNDAEREAREEQAARNAKDQRLSMRAVPRFRLGAAVGSGGTQNHGGVSVYAASIGFRKQLVDVLGLSIDLSATYGRVAGVYDRTTMMNVNTGYAQGDVTVVPYLGPFGRFYVGPACALGLRHYAADRFADGSLIFPTRNRLLTQAAAKTGVLLGSREQVDLWAGFNSAFVDEALWQVEFGVNYEFM